MTLSPTTEARRFAAFFYLAGLQLILAGAWTLTIALSQNLRTTTLLAVAAIGVGIVCFVLPSFLKNYTVNIVSVVGGRLGQLGALAVPVLLSAFLFLRNPSGDALKIMGALLTCIWLIGIEVLFFFQTPREEKPQQVTTSRFVLFSILFAYGILLIPSRVPSLLDGFPWNTPLEFITATLILPLAFFFGRNILSQKAVTLLLVLLLVAKLTLSFFLPQSGLGVRIYTSEEARASGKWERTYGSFLESSYSQVMQLPYRAFYTLPIEYINSHGYNRDTFWLAMELTGAIKLEEDERLVFVVQGASERRLEIKNLETGEIINILSVRSAEDLGTNLFGNIPYTRMAELKGSLTFSNYGNARIEPIILHSDGSIRSALPKFRLNSSSLDISVGGYQIMLYLIGILLLGLLVFSLIDGIYRLYKCAVLDALDVYFALTGILFYYIITVTNKQAIGLLILIWVIFLTLVKWLDFSLRSRLYSKIGYLFSIGIPTLLAFIALDVPVIQNVVQIPQYQDAMEYQWLARNIYVGGDTFLQQTPPWSYKVLYPYIIGFVHILFGQSMSAQLFMNVWCAILSVILMVDIAMFFGVNRRLAFVSASSFLFLLLLPISFIYYFRFGLIEPLAILTLLATCYYAIRNNIAALFASGILTGMLRLNFGGSIFTAITFASTRQFTGSFKQSWIEFLVWCRSNWMRLTAYLITIPAPALLITFLYSRFIPTYTLSPDLNKQNSIFTVLQSLMIVIIGGDMEYLSTKFVNDPVGGLLITIPIVTGLLIALISLVYRKGIFARLDLRLSLFLLSNLPVYAVLKPIAYFPRYSWSFLPPALILLALVLQYRFLKDNKAT